MKTKTITITSTHTTHPFCILALLLGIILFIIYIFDSITHLLNLSESIQGILLAFAIITLGVGIILYFFSYLFAKLSTIASEIDQECELSQNEEDTSEAPIP
ncbi:MAG: hypothetical protein KKG04_10100 [Candidatus Thermoplasmatota archaeon]|nr:hypothetical protein [Candidatus Thermoplasmatota archaeon]